jgi:hypothetical protein
MRGGLGVVKGSVRRAATTAHQSDTRNARNGCRTTSITYTFFVYLLPPRPADSDRRSEPVRAASSPGRRVRSSAATARGWEHPAGRSRDRGGALDASSRQSHAGARGDAPADGRRAAGGRWRRRSAPYGGGAGGAGRRQRALPGGRCARGHRSAGRGPAVVRGAATSRGRDASFGRRVSSGHEATAARLRRAIRASRCVSSRTPRCVRRYHDPRSIRGNAGASRSLRVAVRAAHRS